MVTHFPLLPPACHNFDTKWPNSQYKISGRVDFARGKPIWARLALFSPLGKSCKPSLYLVDGHTEIYRVFTFLSQTKNNDVQKFFPVTVLLIIENSLNPEEDHGQNKIILQHRTFFFSKYFCDILSAESRFSVASNSV